MPILRALLLRASRSPWLADRALRTPFTRRAVRRFMPGETLNEALDAAQELAADGRTIILTQLGENLARPEEAEGVRDHYLDACDRIRARGFRAVISIKPTQLGIDFSLERCADHLDRVAERAAASGIGLQVDMEDSSYVDRTLDLYRGLLARHQGIGLALQAYLRRTPDDLASLLPLRPVIRLVKGAYREPPEVAFPSKREVDAAYLRLADQMLAAAANDGATAIFGTHDPAMWRGVIDRAVTLGAAPGRYEIHMLYGIRTADQRELVRQGQTVATLISYGAAWFPWYMRRLAERPANLWFVARNLVGMG